MAKVKNPRDENNENIIFVKKKNTEDGYTHYAKIKKEKTKSKTSAKPKSDSNN